MIDSHTHLDSCAQPNEELVAAAASAGVQKILTVGMDGATCRTALAAAERFPQVFAAIGRHPNTAHGFDDADLAEIEALAAHPRCVAIGETGLDYFRDRAPRADQERAFHAQIELAREAGKPLVIHTRAAEDDTIATLRRARRGARRGPALLLDARPPRRVRRARALVVLVRRQRHLPERARPRGGRRDACPADRLLVETDAPYLTAQPVRKERNQPAFVTYTAEFVAERRGMTYAELDALVEANAARLFGW